MKKLPLVTTILLTLISSARAGWLTQFGTSSQDTVLSIAVDGSNNVFAGGQTSGSLGAAQAGGGDGFLRKLDSTGAALWTRQVGSSATDSITGVTVAGTDVVVAGNASAALPGQSHAGAGDSFVQRYDTAGTVLWTRQFGTSANDAALSVTSDGSGSLYVGGYTAGSLGGVNAGLEDAYILKLDSSGNTIWTRQFGSAVRDYVEHVAVDSLGNIFLGGHTDGTLPGQASAGGTDGFVMKLDSSGATLWTRQFGSSGDDSVFGLAVDAAGNVFAGGRTSGTLPGQSSAGGIDAFVQKFDATGTDLWTTQFGTSATDGVQELALTSTGGVLAVGNTGGSLAGAFAGGVNDIFAQVFDASGGVVSAYQFGTPTNDTGNTAAVDGLDRLLIGGSTDGALPSQIALGSADGFVMQIDPSPVPEPGTAFFGLACAGIVAVRRRRVNAR